MFVETKIWYGAVLLPRHHEALVHHLQTERLYERDEKAWREVLCLRCPLHFEALKGQPARPCSAIDCTKIAFQKRSDFLLRLLQCSAAHNSSEAVKRPEGYMIRPSRESLVHESIQDIDPRR